MVVKKSKRKKRRRKKGRNTKKKKLVTIIVLAILMIGLIGVLFFDAHSYLYNIIIGNSFDVKPLSFKANVGVGGESVMKVKLTNNENKVQDFNLYFQSLGDVIPWWEKKITLDPWEEREVSILLKDSSRITQVNVGQLVIETPGLTKKIPVVLGVESRNKYFAIVQEALAGYENVYPGGELGLEVKLQNLKDLDSHSIKINYILKKSDDTTVFFEDEALIVGEKYDFSKIIEIPEDISHGSYVFIATIDYEGLKSVSSHIFKIESREKKVSFENPDYFYWIILVIVIGVFMSFRFFVRSKNRLELSLNRMHRNELKRNLKVMISYRKELGKIKNVSNRKMKLNQFDKGRERVLERLKGKQKRQIQEFMGLKKRKKGTKMKRKLNAWKRQGFHMFELKKEIKNIPKHHVNKEVNKWKKQGYNISVLKKR